MTGPLPIHRSRDAVEAAVAKGAVVVTAATGSGKSTEVPRWCPRPVCVVEPRRVACRALAARVAELESTKVGDKVGYAVRDDVRASPRTEILFVTPGVALRGLARYTGYETFVLDEVHERTLEMDLLLALALDRARRLVVMSATVDGARMAEALGAEHVHAEGRTFPVEIGYDDGSPTVPSPDRLSARIARAVRDSDVDTLVFLPGKGEIAKTQSVLSALDAELIPLHGGLGPEAQSRAFRPTQRRKIVLATNVAETSVTVPGVRLVVDSGLVRQVRYVQGRGTLSLQAIARDAAEQRAGRAGRTAPGRCIRLWKRNAHLEVATPPELHRMPLVPLVLAAAVHGAKPNELEWVDAPKGHAVEEATAELRALGALDEEGRVTERGKALFHLPIDPWLGRILVEAEATNLLDPAIDLVSALAVGRPMFRGPPGEDDELRKQGCDLLALMGAMRAVPSPSLDPGARDEARQHRDRLRRAFGRGDDRSDEIPRDALLEIILRADPRAARVARPRGRSMMWGGAGTEVEVERGSAVAQRANEPDGAWPDAVVVLGLRSLRDGARTRLLATAAAGVPLATLDRLGLGEPRLGAVRLERGRVVIDVERSLAGKVLGTETQRPQGELLREAVVTLIERGRLFRGVFHDTQGRLEVTQLAHRLAGAQLLRSSDLPELRTADPKAHLSLRLAELGLELEEDLALLEPEDLLPEALESYVQEALDRDYPRRVELGEAKYAVRYELGRRRAILELVAGNRKKAPPRNYLPRFPGFKVLIQAGGTTVEL